MGLFFTNNSRFLWGSSEKSPVTKELPTIYLNNARGFYYSDFAGIFPPSEIMRV